MCGSEPVMANVPMERVKGLYGELLFPLQTTEIEILAARNSLADELGCAYTWQGIHWRDAAVRVTLRVDRMLEPLNETELFSYPDDSSSLKLWNFQNAIRIHDPSERFRRSQDKLGYYSEDTWNDKLIFCWFLLRFRASWDFRNSVRRRQIGSAHQYFGMALGSLISFCFLLNREYPPVPELTRTHLLPKFLADEVARLPILGSDISCFLAKLNDIHTLEDFLSVIWDAYVFYTDFLSENGMNLEEYIFQSNRNNNPFKEGDVRWTK
jgi:hypothetical protein